ncbi:hypothetical protein CSQ32_001281 [Salmonella enterica subsp. diarizonae]|nr:hypothetical protein [Salmonella enterica]ECE5792334.1 hypothetical protein [Salmonella enterica subsp. diarizonae]EAT6913772.1 hypothetical protein [Salmonella enterica]EBC8286922.1 hypothetical protein [Salmonella enterica]EBJ5712371.1 hypothetical protein [Salmonella enterica]
MIDMPPECPPGMSVFDVITIHAQDLVKNKNAEYVCFLQVPDNLKDKDYRGYPYFDFDSARKQNQVQTQADAELTDEILPGDFYLAVLLGGITFLAFAFGFLAGFIPQG